MRRHFIKRALQHLDPADLPASKGSMMLKDETICIRCGLCAERCPAHTITMEAFQVFDQDPESTWSWRCKRHERRLWLQL